MQDLQIMKNYYLEILKNKIDIKDCEKVIDLLCCEKADFKFDNNDIKIFQKFKFSSEELIVLAEDLLKCSNYIPLKNFLRVLLASEQWGEIVFFFSKIFSQHISNLNFISKNASKFDMGERTFDKFIEATIYTKIPFEEIIDFFLVILESSQNDLISRWKRPVVDYFIDYAVLNEKKLLKLIFSNFGKYGVKCFQFLINQDINYAIPRLMDYWLNNEFEQKRQIKNILKQHYQQVKEYYFTLIDENKISLKQQIEILLLYVNYDDVKQILLSIYQKTKDNFIKNIILENIDIQFKPEITTLMQFKKNCLNYNLKIDEYLGKKLSEYPDLIFKKGDKAELEVLGYMLQQYKKLFSTSAVGQLSYFKEFISQQSLDNLVNFISTIVLKDNFKVENDWAFVLVFQNSSLEELVKFIKKYAKLKNNYGLNLNQFAKILCETKREDIFDCVLKLDVKNENEIIQSILQEAEHCGKYDIFQIENTKDLLVQSFNFDCNGIIKINNSNISVDENLEVTFNVNTDNISEKNKLLHCVKNLKKEIQKQSIRLERAFLSGRNWSKTDFQKIFLKNGLMNVLAQRLIWGSYKNGCLYSIFEINGTEIKNIESFVDDKNENESYAIFHPIEYQNNDYIKEFYAGKPPFNQIHREISLLSNFNTHSSSVTRFNGVIVNAKTFLNRMKLNKWKFGILTFDNCINNMFKYNKDLSTLCEITFSPLRLNNIENEIMSLFELRFYRGNTIISVGNSWFVNKINSVEIGSVNPRLFSDTIYEIFNASKK